MIRGYHIHVYYNSDQWETAESIRSALLREVPGIRGAGPLRDGPVGPHPRPMFEAWFKPEALSEVLPWILLNRKGLNVLLHPLTGNDYDDHAQHAVWIGGVEPLDFSILKDI